MRMFALRDRWSVRNEHKAFYLKKCWWSSHKPGQNTVRLTQSTLVRTLIQTNLINMVILAVASFNETIVSANIMSSFHLNSIKKGHILCTITQNKSIFGRVVSKT